MSSKYRSHAASGNTSSAPEIRCMPETQAVTGMRISNSSADRLRYFGRGFFAAAVDMRLVPVPQFPPRGAERFDYSVAAQQPAAVKSKSHLTLKSRGVSR